jgi:molybdopterin-guanine dinucleotide biosynthesis protein
MAIVARQRGLWGGGVVVVFTFTGTYSSTSNNEALKILSKSLERITDSPLIEGFRSMLFRR